MKIIGREKVDYVSKKTNNPVRGITLHCTSERDKVEGLAVETIFISERSETYTNVLSLPIGTDILCSYNRWGSIDNVVPKSNK